MIIEQLRNLLILGLFMIVLMSINKFYPNNPICPDSIKDTEQRTIEFKKWVDDFYEGNPNASNEEAMGSRRDFLAKNNCKEALKTHNFYITGNGKVVEEITEAEGTMRAEKLEKQLNTCPDDFKNSKEEIAFFSKWLDNFYSKKPNATMKEMSRARVDFWIDNNCKEALKRYADYMSGNVDDETKQLIETIIKEETTTLREKNQV